MHTLRRSIQHLWFLYDFGFDCINRKSSNFTKELICKRCDLWGERISFGLKRKLYDSPASFNTKRRELSLNYEVLFYT